MQAVVVAEGAGGDALRCDAVLDEIGFHAFGAALGETEGFGAVERLVGKAVDGDVQGGLVGQLLQELLQFDLASSVAGGPVFVEREVDAIDDLCAASECGRDGLLAEGTVEAPGLHVSGAFEDGEAGEQPLQVVEHGLEAGEVAGDPAVGVAREGQGESAGFGGWAVE